MSRYVRKDENYRRAKAEGLRSRAAYKLLELDRRLKLLGRGRRVVDLGCWPGAWLQVAAERVGPKGRVVGVDLVPTAPLALPGVVILTGDVGDSAVAAQVAAALEGPADVVLSDLAPKLTGVRAADAVRHAALLRIAAERARQWLRPAGILVAKIFMDGEYEETMRDLRASFATVRTLKLAGTRTGSSELYVCARDPRPLEGASPAGSAVPDAPPADRPPG